MQPQAIPIPLPPAAGGGTVNVPTPADVSSMLDPRAWAEAFLRPIALWGFYGAMVGLGLIVMLIGVWMLVMESSAADKARALIGAGVARFKGGGAIGG